MPNPRRHEALNLNLCCGPHLCAARPRIAIHFFITRRYRLLGQHLVPTAHRAFFDRVFGDPVFQGVEADDHQPPSWFKDAERYATPLGFAHWGPRAGCFSGYERSQIVQLTVYEYSDGLKGARRGMQMLLNAPGFHWPGSGRYNLC